MLRETSTIFLIAAVCSLAGCGSDQPDTATPDDPVEPVKATYQNLDPSVGYVGIEACVECHSVQGATYVESQMGRSFKPALKSSSVADWDNASPVYEPVTDFYYYPFAVGDSLFLMEYRLSSGDTTHKRVEKIDYIVGSGHHTNSHMLEENGYVYQMPITWYVQERRWDMPPGFDGGSNWRFERAIEVECMTCHNGMPDYVVGSDNRYDALPHGINCERCHGPGELHVEEKRAGKIIDTSVQADLSIVNPARLPRELQFDVCQRCHLQGVAVPKEGQSFTDFRPGMKLGDVIDVYFPRYTDSLSQFIMASHPDRLRMSECRIPSADVPGRLDPLPCITCHDPHVPIEALGRDAYNGACIDCHSGESPAATAVQSPVVLPECSEDLAVRQVNGDDCSSCHMPVVESIDIPHVRITDHNIRVVEDEPNSGLNQPSNEEKRFVRLAALTTGSPTYKQLGEGYLAYYEQFNNVPQFLDSAAANLTRASRADGAAGMQQALIRLWYLQEEYDKIVSLAEVNPISPDDPWTLYRVGEAFAKVGRNEGARDYYQLAVDAGPDHLWFRTKLATSYVALRRPERAIAILDAVLTDNPKFHHALNNRGFAHLLAGNYEQAESDFVRTLELDPDEKQALANLASYYFNSGDPNLARPLIGRLLKLEPTNEQYLRFRDAVDSAL